MNDTNRVRRRAVLQVAGGAAIASIVAGCLDRSRVDSESSLGAGGDANGTTDETDGTENETASSDTTDESDAADADADASADDEETASESDLEDDMPSDDDHEETESVGPIAIDPGTRIVLYGGTAAWEGLEPAPIEGVENPTLVLKDGETYEIGWQEGDGMVHNLELRNADGTVVDDLATELASEGGDEQFLEFTASPELAQYVCAPHEVTMVGDLQVE
ncbi:plastocyanin/azurin family copper-binding protein [Natronorubrum thiooxidans]|uniref:Copper binding protein, plastocyanin/azurin family n=1 Tax=Natronorubrum thiooxidans TaxID=308853 RepID=A0A1N7EX41_9EURY|nr:plastocyanin/azurin family copper-binding protein [Natronorubrum thiooxidans]SIR92651.1 Copper binding protein, plastocyanin/azurin family [Natronorubrum thiooxidans]